MTVKNVVNKFINGIQNRDVAAVADTLAENVTFQDTPKGSEGLINGHKLVVEMYKGFFGVATKIEWEILSNVLENNTAVIERINHISLESGKLINLPIVTVLELADDKIVKIRDYFDFKMFSDQLQ